MRLKARSEKITTYLQTISKPNNHENNREHRVGRMHTNHHISHKMADRRSDRNPKLPKVVMNRVVERSGNSVAHKRRQEDERDDGVVQVVVCFELA